VPITNHKAMPAHQFRGYNPLAPGTGAWQIISIHMFNDESYMSNEVVQNGEGMAYNKLR